MRHIGPKTLTTIFRLLGRSPALFRKDSKSKRILEVSGLGRLDRFSTYSNGVTPEMPLIDRFNRSIDYLRVSVTDRCNFRCIYCMPEEGVPAIPKKDQLTPFELNRVLGIAGKLGMRKIRFTGGEPLLIKDLEKLVRTAQESGFRDISLTTNGFGLAERATALRDAGLNRVNISLDTLKEDRFTTIARRGDLKSVLSAIDASLSADLHPVKINLVAMRGINSDEAVSFARWTLRTPIHVRFIELMPIRWNLDEDRPFDPFTAHGSSHLLQLKTVQGGMLDSLEMRRRFISRDELRQDIESALGPLAASTVQTNGPARTFRLPDSLGTIGFISQISDDICSNCNRLRLTSDGHLRPCLMSDGELDLKPGLRSSRADADLISLFRKVVVEKPERHYLSEGQRVTGRNMSQIGG